MRLAEKIPILVKTRGMTQAELARAIGTYPARVSEWISGKGSPSVEQALRMARAFGVTLDYLADESADEPPPVLSEVDRQVAAVIRTIGPEEAYRRLVQAGSPSGAVLTPVVVGSQAVRPAADRMKGTG